MAKKGYVRKFPQLTHAKSEDPSGRWDLRYGGRLETWDGRLSMALLRAAHIALSYKEVRIDSNTDMEGNPDDSFTFFLRA